MVDMSKYNGAYNMGAATTYMNRWFTHNKDGHLCHPIMNWFGLRFLIASGISNGFYIRADCTGTIKCTESLLASFFAKHKVERCLEIGTYLGTMALLLADSCDQVTTIDIVPRTDPLDLWKVFGAKNINYLVFDDQKEIDGFTNSLDFDFAYLDGDHEYESVSHDFSLVKSCGRVLFHDYWSNHPGIKTFIDELPENELTFMEPFVYWEAA